MHSCTANGLSSWCFFKITKARRKSKEQIKRKVLKIPSLLPPNFLEYFPKAPTSPKAALFISFSSPSTFQFFLLFSLYGFIFECIPHLLIRNPVCLHVFWILLREKLVSTEISYKFHSQAAQTDYLARFWTEEEKKTSAKEEIKAIIKIFTWNAYLLLKG